MTEPMTPPECDLRDFSFMPLDVARVRDSKAASLPDPEAFRACVLAWCVSWHQVPAGSLPDDDAELSSLLGYGRTIAAWRKVRAAGGLHGWVLCTDGRLYHPVVCEKALEAWQRKEMQRARGKKGNEVRWGARAGRDAKGTGEGSGSDASSLDGDHHADEQGCRKDASSVLKGHEERPQRTLDASLKEEKTVLKNRKGQGHGKEERKTERATALSPSNSPDAFDEFWAIYPRKVGKDAARKAFAAALRRGAPASAVIASVGMQRWNPDPQFIPHPATWLNGGRWQDDPDAAAPPPSLHHHATPLNESRAERFFREARDLLDVGNPLQDLDNERLH